jgi:hypothetical protein
MGQREMKEWETRRDGDGVRKKKEDTETLRWGGPSNAEFGGRKGEKFPQ